MTTIYRPDANRVLVGDVKRLIREAVPRERFVEVHADMDDEGNFIPGGRMQATQVELSRCGPWLDARFPVACGQLGIAPRMLWDPTTQDYTGSGWHDAGYTITHDEFVKLAGLYGVAVMVGKPHAATDGPQVAPDRAQHAPRTNILPMSRAGLVLAHKAQWPTIKSDLNKASENDLAAAAKRGTRGWDEVAALDWARSKGKLHSTATAIPRAGPFDGLSSGQVHLIEG